MLVGMIVSKVAVQYTSYGHRQVHWVKHKDVAMDKISEHGA